jgi:hypothetical protein
MVCQRRNGCISQVAEIEVADPRIAERQKNLACCPDCLPAKSAEVLHKEIRAQNSVGNARGAHGIIDHRVTAAESSLVVRFGSEAGEPKEPVYTGGLRGGYGVQAKRFHILNV